MKKAWIAAAIATVLAVLILVIGAAPGTARQRHAEPFRGSVQVVQPGESLWSVIHQAYPSGDPRESIDRVKRANHLRQSSLTPGQRLLLPA
ncbi:MAG: hypothetical protein NVSMB57_03610 [Actinomycetota bacterium]